MKKSSYLIAALATVAVLGTAVAGADAAVKSTKQKVAGAIATAGKNAKAALSPDAALAAKTKLTVDTAAQKLLAKDVKTLGLLKKAGIGAAGTDKAAATSVTTAYNYAFGTNGITSLAGNTVTIGTGATASTLKFAIPTGDVLSVTNGTSLTSLNSLKSYWNTQVKADKADVKAKTTPSDAAVAALFASSLKGSSDTCISFGGVYASATPSCTF